MKYLNRALVYGAHLALCMDEREYTRELKRLKVSTSVPFLTGDSHACTHTFERSDGDVTCIVTMKPKPHWNLETIYALLVHEATHIWRQTREFIGETNPSPEFEAYSMQNISQRLFEAYREKTRRRRKR